MRVFNLSGSITPIYTQTCAGSTETLQGEIDQSAHPTRAYPSFSCKKELGVLLPPPPPFKDRISVFYRVMPWLFVKFL